MNAELQRAVTAATDLCRRAEPILKIASFVPTPEAHVVVVAVSATCAPLLAGVIPTTFDANTPLWLEKNFDDLIKVLPR